jgi:hypothetical protein
MDLFPEELYQCHYLVPARSHFRLRTRALRQKKDNSFLKPMSLQVYQADNQVHEEFFQLFAWFLQILLPFYV